MALLLVAALCAAAALQLVVVAPRRTRRGELARAARYGGTRRHAGLSAPRLGPAAAALAQGARRLTPKRRRERVAQRLHDAGLAGRIPPEAYVGVKCALALPGILGGILIGSSSGRAGMGLLIAALFATAGFIVPDAYVKARAGRRHDAILASLPDALDLLAVSVEAGLGLDGAIARYAENAQGPLAAEFGRVGAELRVGAGRQEVLRRFAERVPALETAAFVRAVVHADQLGVSLTRTLRTQAAETRRRRQARAEEIANRAPVKMLFPTIFLVFPALFVVVLGPALLYLATAFPS